MKIVLFLLIISFPAWSVPLLVKIGKLGAAVLNIFWKGDALDCRAERN